METAIGTVLGSICGGLIAFFVTRWYFIAQHSYFGSTRRCFYSPATSGGSSSSSLLDNRWITCLYSRLTVTIGLGYQFRADWLGWRRLRIHANRRDGGPRCFRVRGNGSLLDRWCGTFGFANWLDAEDKGSGAESLNQFPTLYRFPHAVSDLAGLARP